MKNGQFVTVQVMGTRYAITKHAKKRIEQRFLKKRVPWRTAIEFAIGWQNRMNCVWHESGHKKTLITCYPKKLERIA